MQATLEAYANDNGEAALNRPTWISDAANISMEPIETHNHRAADSAGQRGLLSLCTSNSGDAFERFIPL